MTSPSSDHLDLLPDIVWEADAAGRLVWCNAAGRSYAPDGAHDPGAEDGWLALAHPDDREELTTQRAGAIRAGRSYEFTCRLRRHDGEHRWHRVRGVPTHDPEGHVAGWLGTCVDIHDLHVAEEKVTVARALLHEAPLGFGFVDTDLRYAYLTPRLARMHGRPVEDHLGRTLAEVVPDLWDEVGHHYHHVLSTGEAVRGIEVSWTSGEPEADRRTWAVDYYPIDRDGVRLGVAVLVHEITELLTHTHELERRNRMLTRAESIAGIGTFEHDLVSGRGWATPGLYDLLGLAPDAAPGLAEFRDLVRPDERDQVEATFAQLLVSDEPLRQHYHVLDDDGRERLLELHASAERDDDGRPVKLVGTYQDVTARVAAEEERVGLLERTISAADTERRRIAEHLHDEAIQALTAAMFRIEHAEQTGSTNDLGSARDAVRRAIEDLRLTILELLPADVTAADLEDAIATYLQHTFSDQPLEVDLTVDIPDRADVADTIAVTAKRIVQEAVSNVRRHAGADHLWVHLWIDGGVLAGSVRDDGIGLQQRAAPGHVGLRLMRDRAAAVGGRVSIAGAADDRGTEVRFDLPL